MAEEKTVVEISKQTNPVAGPARFREIGMPGLNRWGGTIFEEYLTQLRGIRGIRTYVEMRDSDPVVGAMLFAFEMLARQATWRIEPFSEENGDKEIAEFIERALFEDMKPSWQNTLSEIFSMLVFGWSFMEVVYKRRSGLRGQSASKFTDNRIGWKKWGLRSQESLDEWILDDHGEILGMKQAPLEGGPTVTIPMQKALLFRTRAEKNNPQGRSVLRNAYRSWYFKKRIEEIEGIGIERDLAGLPMIGVPATMFDVNADEATKAALQQYKTMARNLRRDEQEGIVYPLSYTEEGHEKYKISLLNTGGRRQMDTSSVIARKNQEIAMTMLADFILIGHEKVGSFALTDSKTHIFSVALGGILDIIADTINEDEIPKVVALNGWPVDRAPKLMHGDIETPDLEELSNYVSRLASAGIDFSDEASQRHFRSVAGIPLLDEEEGDETLRGDAANAKDHLDDTNSAQT